MKNVLIVIAVLASCGSMGQEMDMTPPKELQSVAFMLGTFRGTETYTFGGPPEKGTAVIRSAKGVGGRYIVGNHSSKSKSMTMEGMHMLTYDKEMKKYRAWWFDNASSYAMELSGSLKGNTLTMTSTPTPMPGMEPAVFRASWTKTGPRKVKFVLQMQQGTAWVTAMEGNYSR